MVEEEEWKPKLKRSTSNPFLYFNERRNEIMEIKQDFGEEEGKRHEQTEIFGENFRMNHN